MTANISQRAIARALIALLILVSIPMGAAGTALATTDTTITAESIDTSVVSLQEQTNETSTETSSQTGPTDASQVRIQPDIPNEDYVDVETVKSDEQFNTSGGFATFTLSRPVESARIAQPNADARVIANGFAIRVEYADNAAPRDSTTFYTLELFFPDDSERDVKLYATNTAVSADAAISPEYKEFINYVEDAAEDHGYEATPDGALAYVQNREEMAEWFEGLWGDSIETFLALRLAQVFSPFDWFFGLLALIIGSIFLSRKHGWILRLHQTAVSTAELMRERARQDWEERRNTAAKHRLSDVEGIGTNAVRYWREIGVETVDDIVEVACKGMHAVDEQGNILRDTNGEPIWAHKGVKEFTNVTPLTERKLREETWLKPLILEGQLRATTALSNIEQALRVAEEQYGRGNEVRESRRTIEELIRVLRGERDYEDFRNAQRQSQSVSTSTSSTDSHDGRGSPTGAD